MVSMSKEAEQELVMSRQVYDDERKKISFSSRLATDSKQNTHVYLPKAAEIRKETEI